jgi:hypothetical protein
VILSDISPTPGSIHSFLAFLFCGLLDWPLVQGAVQPCKMLEMTSTPVNLLKRLRDRTRATVTARRSAA